MGVRDFLGFPEGKESYDKFSFVILTTTIFVMAIVTLYESIFLEIPTTDLFMGIGSFIFIAGVVIRLVASNTLGKHFSLRVIEVDDHLLVKEGIYSKIRHPLYSGGLLMALGFVTFFNSYYGSLLLLPILAAGYYRIKVEEDFLLKKFGHSYKNYMLRVKGLIPYIW